MSSIGMLQMMEEYQWVLRIYVCISGMFLYTMMTVYYSDLTVWIAAAFQTYLYYLYIILLALYTLLL